MEHESYISIYSQKDISEWVYFVEMGDGGPIKIGKAIDIKKRILGLQTGSPYKIRLLGAEPNAYRSTPGSSPTLADIMIPTKEKELHSMFGCHRLEGEWFHRHYTLLNYISELPCNKTKDVNFSKKSFERQKDERTDAYIEKMKIEIERLSGIISDISKNNDLLSIQNKNKQYELEEAHMRYLGSICNLVESIEKSLEDFYYIPDRRTKKYASASEKTEQVISGLLRATHSGSLSKLLEFCKEYDPGRGYSFSNYKDRQDFTIENDRIIIKHKQNLERILGIDIHIKSKSDKMPEEKT